MVKNGVENKKRRKKALTNSFETRPYMIIAVHCTATPKFNSGQPNPALIQRLARKKFGVRHTAMSCWGSFRSSWWECSHSLFSFFLYLFTNPLRAKTKNLCDTWFFIKKFPYYELILGINLTLPSVTNIAKQWWILVATKTIPIVSLGIGFTLRWAAAFSQIHLKKSRW